MSTTFPVSQHIGIIIDGRFTLLRWLGGTRRTSVFFTQIDGDPARPAAIKLISAEAVDADARLGLWSTAQSLSHPNLVRLFAFGRCTVDGMDCLYAVTEYADELLSEILPERALTPAETRELLAPILAALTYLHSRKLAHAALKPSNLLVVHDQLKLSVDEICRSGEPDTRAACAAEYDAPEVASGLLSPAADLWSLGMLVVAALTQHPAAWQRASGDPAVPPGLHVPFLAIVEQCLRIDPARRGTLNDVKTALEPDREPKKPAAEKAPAANASKMRLVVLAGTLLVVAVVYAVVRLSSHPATVQAPTTTAAQPAETQQPEAPATIAPQQQAETPKPKPSPIPQQLAKPAETVAPTPAPPAAPAPSAAASMVDAGSAHGPLPEVPDAARNTIHGQFRSTIRVEVDSAGNVTSAAIDSQGPSSYFANFALQAARKWKFKPEAGAWILEFHFRQDGTTVTPTPATR